MTIKTTGWTAQIDRRPGTQSFRTFGTVTVANSGITPKLVFMPLQDKSFNLRLELVLEKADGMSLQALTDKYVEYKTLGNSNVTGVSIFFEGKLLQHVNIELINP
ncbi:MULTISPECIES: hypothetical protein [unclassified Pseudomonas]|jgi:hypothetical protein|uniref:hypothetical protein n=1 Tax=unclassified Pseudomonas TaxID=196821 RepID=UPI001390FCDE|nr:MULTISPECIES: hypothetical protein [unclassified Pseudomonas]KAI2694147.1 hypothetical protein GBC55_002390 [Pseudomonas sp. TNT3]MBF4555674.1 hypothetical protein [Pseudomonas sp. p50(2008)]